MAKQQKQAIPTCPSFLGTTTMGERGQVVIPKDVRELYDLQAGDQLMVIVAHKQAFALVPVKKAKELMQAMNQQISHALKQTM